ncbi:glycosyltransferase [Glutamicibacter sp. HZAU]|uniref:glycosyltransferase n=1 Tax=Glutamicibacter sp. HZAU TaxID=2049891 RepID=UPI001375E658|nr:glycosyltransferase [Glutamicibacter sp. HZAU]
MYSGNVDGLKFSKPSGTPHVLFVTSNGAGMGHITRCLAIAKSGTAQFQSSFVTLSTSAEVIGEQGFEYLHFASSGTTGQPARIWNNNFYQFFNQLTRLNKFDAVVFDGTWIYRGLRDVLDKCPELRLIWLRRGLWKQTARIDQLPAMEGYCSKILTPWDVGESLDQGALSKVRTQTPVRGIVLSDGELLPRDVALEKLDLDSSKHYALIQLGAGNINDISDTRKKVSEAIRNLSNGSVIPILASSPLSQQSQCEYDPRTIRKYPISPYLRAFDFVVSAAGYNSIHELIRWNIRSLVIPNLDANTDDQQARAYALQDEMNHFTAITDSDILTGISSLLRKEAEISATESASIKYSKFIDSGYDAARAISETIGPRK